jgi:hypothetical protein
LIPQRVLLWFVPAKAATPVRLLTKNEAKGHGRLGGHEKTRRDGLAMTQSLTLPNL